MTTSSQATAVEFVVSYEGVALAEHTMPVRDLAPALLALGQAFDRANTLLNGDRASVSLEIRATNQGSFEIALILQQLVEGAADFLSDDFVTSAANLTGLLIGGTTGGIGLFRVIKWAQGKRPEVHHATAGTDNVELEIDKLRLRIPTRLLELFNDTTLRQQLEAVVRPVTKEGIDRLVFRGDSQPLETVEKTEAPYFRAESTNPQGTTETIIPRQRLQPASVNFAKRGKWRLTDGEKTRWYTIKDNEFMKQVEQGQRRFGSKDLFVCEVVMTQSLESNGDLKLSYAITDVIEHFAPPEQGKMFGDDPN